MTMVETYSPWAYAALGVVALALGLVLAVDHHGSVAPGCPLVSRAGSGGEAIDIAAARNNRVQGAEVDGAVVCFCSRMARSRLSRRCPKVSSSPSTSPFHPSVSARSLLAIRSASSSSKRRIIRGSTWSMGQRTQACSCAQGVP